MRFYEVHTSVLPHFYVQEDPYPRVVSINCTVGDNDGAGERLFFCLPLGNSLRRHMIHPERYVLKHGALFNTKTSGTIIVAQTTQESMKDRSALILLTTPPPPGGHVVYSRAVDKEGCKYDPPEVVDSIPIYGHSRYFYEHLLLFREGQGLVVQQYKGDEKHKEFTLCWNGHRLHNGKTKPRVKKQSRQRPRPAPTQ